MDRRSFLLTGLLPIVAAKRGLVGPPDLRQIMRKRFLVMKTRQVGASQLVHAKMVAASEAMGRRFAEDIYFA